VRDVFDLSNADNTITPSLPSSLSVLSENQMKATSLLQLRSSEVRVVFNLSTSDNLTATPAPQFFAVLS
jgi:hypothetical protein